MIESACSDCGKVWKLPHADRVFRCKECGGSVDPGDRSPDAEPAEWPESPNCPECSELNAVGSQFCESCGAAMSKEKASTGPRPSLEVDRREANREFGRLKSSLRAFRAFFIAGALGSGIIAIVFGFTFSSGEGQEKGHMLIVCVVAIAMTILYTAGAIRVTQQPFIWAAGLTALQTAIAVASLLSSGGIRSSIFAMACWFVLSRAGRAQKLIDTHPELISKKKRTSNPKSEAGRSRIKRGRAGRGKELLIFVSAALLLLVVVFGATQCTIARDGFGEVDEFRDTWNEEGHGAVLSLFEERPAKVQRRLNDEFLRRRLKTRWPELGEPRIERDESNSGVKFLLAYFPYRDDELKVTFRSKINDHWELWRISFPAMKASRDPATFSDPFRKIWTTATPEEFRPYFVPALRGKIARSLTRMFGERNWQDARPALGPPQVEDSSRQDKKVLYFPIEGGGSLKMSIQWHPEGWLASSFRPPQ